MVFPQDVMSFPQDKITLLVPQDNMSFPQCIMLFIKESYFVPAIPYVVPSRYNSFPLDTKSFPQDTIYM